jgi:hypothetical protein
MRSSGKGNIVLSPRTFSILSSRLFLWPLNSVNGHKRRAVQVRLERGEYTERSENKAERRFLDGGIDITEVVVW